jgi:hypothetical protein
MSLRNWHQRFRQWFFVDKKAKRTKPPRLVERLEIRSLMSVSPSGVTINATEAASFTGTVATFTSNDSPQAASDYSATIKWGDGATSTGTIAAAAHGYNVNGQHTYADDGGYAMTRHHGKSERLLGRDQLGRWPDEQRHAGLHVGHELRSAGKPCLR